MATAQPLRGFLFYLTKSYFSPYSIAEQKRKQNTIMKCDHVSLRQEAERVTKPWPGPAKKNYIATLVLITLIVHSKMFDTSQNVLRGGVA